MPSAPTCCARPHVQGLGRSPGNCSQWGCGLVLLRKPTLPTNKFNKHWKLCRWRWPCIGLGICCCHSMFQPCCHPARLNTYGSGRPMCGGPRKTSVWWTPGRRPLLLPLPRSRPQTTRSTRFPCRHTMTLAWPAFE